MFYMEVRILLSSITIYTLLDCTSIELIILHLCACRYRRKREKLVERISFSNLPTKWGLFQAYAYRSKLDGIEHIVLVKVTLNLH